MTDKNNYLVVGLMSGTSLDGLDIVLCEFSHERETWCYEILHGETRMFPEDLSQRLQEAHRSSAMDFISLDNDFGHWCGLQVREVCENHRFTPLLVASHGHTVFHEPGKGITCQIGNASRLSVSSGYMVVNDFRTADVALGGQGAPLVPVGDHLLFSSFGHCLNIGGIANISFVKNGRRRAFDIVPANMVLNHLANRLGLTYDNKGIVAASGELCEKLLTQLNALSYYRHPPPKSLGREWVSQEIIPLLDQGYNTNDLLRTLSEHIALQIAKVINANPANGSVLVTGGGARNVFLISLISSLTDAELISPSDAIIDFKEALIFGFMGLLRFLKIPNVMASVTGAAYDHCAGSLTIGNQQIDI